MVSSNKRAPSLHQFETPPNLSSFEFAGNINIISASKGTTENWE